MTAYYVYEFYDADGDALYVGCTSKLGPRIAHHAANQPWWSRVARIAVDVYAEKRAGLDAEAELIGALNPTYNVVHTPRGDEKTARGISTRTANLRKRHDLGLCAWSCTWCREQRRAAS